MKPSGPRPRVETARGTAIPSFFFPGACVSPHPPFPPQTHTHTPYLAGGRAAPRRGPGQASTGSAEVGGGHVLLLQPAARRLPHPQPPIRAGDGEKTAVAGGEGAKGRRRRRLPATRCRRHGASPRPAPPRRRMHRPRARHRAPAPRSPMTPGRCHRRARGRPLNVSSRLFLS